jgi:hypothetical protein
MLKDILDYIRICGPDTRRLIKKAKHSGHKNGTGNQKDTDP